MTLVQSEAAGGGFRRRMVGSQLAEEPAYFVTRLLPRDPRIWLFGYNRGFGGNTRYLAEFVKGADLGVEAWWLARTTSEAAAARKSGLRVAMRRRGDGVRVELRAGVAIVSGALSDLPLAARSGSFVVHLHHGIPIKRIGLDLEAGHSITGPRGFRSALARLDRWGHRRALSRIDMVVAPGELAKSRYITALGAPPSRVKVLGTPRFDVLHGGDAYARVAGRDLKQSLGIAEDEYVALWLPTWREGVGETWLPSLQEADIDQTIGSHKIVVLVKPHPFSDRDAFDRRLPRHAQLRLLERDVDPNALLRIADALISDYSSAVFDYAILERPIYFMTPDLENYAANDRGFYEPITSLTGGEEYRDWVSLLSAVTAGATGDDSAGVALARRIREQARNNDLPGSSARISAAIAESVGLPEVAEAARAEAARAEAARAEAQRAL